MADRPVVLTIAGLDPSGGAGIAADLRMFERLGAHGAVIVATQTVQDTRGVAAVVPVDPDLVQAQLRRLTADVAVRAVKVGLVADAALAAGLARWLPALGAPVVVDPVLRASSGDPLAAAAALRPLLEVAALITPNAAEFAAIGSVSTPTLVTGGDLGGAVVADTLWFGGAPRQTWFAPRIAEPDSAAGAGWRGTGCALSAAIAVHLAHGRSIPAAITEARRAVRARLPAGVAIGGGRWVL